MTYRRVVVNRTGGPDVLEVAEEEVREPGPGQVRVRVLAAGVAFADILMCEGAYPGGPRPPFTPGYDLVGVVDAVGEGVSSVRPDQVVAALTVFGGYTEVAYLPETELVAVPAGLDGVEALALVLNYVSAWQILHRVARARRGRFWHGRAAVEPPGGPGHVRHRVGGQAGSRRRVGRRPDRLPEGRFPRACPRRGSGAFMLGRSGRVLCRPA